MEATIGSRWRASRPGTAPAVPIRTSRLLLGALLAAAALAGGAAAAGAAPTTWLCRPGRADDPCAGSLATTRFGPTGQVLGTSRPRVDRHRPVACFFVYPTVSDEPTVSASLSVRPELRSIARFQAARFAQHCRVYAPVYRQITLAGLQAPAADQTTAGALAYGDVRAAFRSFLRRIGSRRGFVLIGHSQGSFHLRRLIRE